VYDAFTRQLAAAVSALKVGDGMEAGTQQGPLINESAVQTVEAHIADATAKGAKVLTGGRRHAKGGTFFEPTVLTGVTGQMRCAVEETFGPVPVIGSATEAEAFGSQRRFQHGIVCLHRDWRAPMMSGGSRPEWGVNTGLISTEVAPLAA
jgi:succinate-semialdehyde dehydrogenase/glutarate-semialdehyde dehydrogenase